VRAATLGKCDLFLLPLEQNGLFVRFGKRSHLIPLCICAHGTHGTHDTHDTTRIRNATHGTHDTQRKVSKRVNCQGIDRKQEYR